MPQALYVCYSKRSFLRFNCTDVCFKVFMLYLYLYSICNETHYPICAVFCVAKNTYQLYLENSSFKFYPIVFHQMMLCSYPGPFKYPIFFVTGHCSFSWLRHGMLVCRKKLVCVSVCFHFLYCYIHSWVGISYHSFMSYISMFWPYVFCLS